MPRHQKTMKDVATCEKLRGGGKQPLIRRYPNGVTRYKLHFIAGYPIRISPDQRLLTTSPKLFAGCYVLHRLLMSRHPPFALCNHQITKDFTLIFLTYNS